MSIYLIIILIILIIGILAFRKERPLGKLPSEVLPYKAIPLFNPAEKSFYEALRPIIKDEYTIFSKVRLLDLLKIKTYGKRYLIYFRKVSQKHIDFILCDPKDFTVKLAIELDGSGHNELEQKEKDNFKDKILKTAGIPVLRIQAAKSYDSKELKERISGCVKSSLPPNQAHRP